MKLSEIKNDEALDVLADLIEPASLIIADEEVKRIAKDEPRLKLVSYIIKHHKKEVVEIMARLDGANPEEYEFNLLTLPVKVLEILNDEELQNLFT